MTRKNTKASWRELAATLIREGDFLFVTHSHLAAACNSKPETILARVKRKKRTLGRVCIDAGGTLLSCDQASALAPRHADDLARAFLARQAMDSGITLEVLAAHGRGLADMALTPLGRIALERDILAGAVSHVAASENPNSLGNGGP